MNQLIKMTTILLIISFFSINTFAETNIKDQITNSYRQLKDPCIAVKKLIKEKMDAKEVVKTGIQLGHSSCLIVRCAVEAGGTLKDIIAGALEAGASTDVIARCSIDGGADPKDVAAILSDLSQMAFCVEPEMPMETIEMSLPGEGNQGGGIISPFNF